MQKYKITWKEYNDLINDMVETIKEDFDGGALNDLGIYGINRGGMIPANHVSNILGLPLGIIDHRSREGKSVTPKVLKNTNRSFNIVIDDIWDSGKTMNEVLESSDIISGYVLCNQSFLMPDVSSMAQMSGKCVVFPWEEPDLVGTTKIASGDY